MAKMGLIPDDSVAVTPSDSVALPANVQALYVGTSGNVALKRPGNDIAVTYVNVPAGAYIPGRVEYVMATNTTASDIVAEIG